MSFFVTAIRLAGVRSSIARSVESGGTHLDETSPGLTVSRRGRQQVAGDERPICEHLLATAIALTTRIWPFYWTERSCGFLPRHYQAGCFPRESTCFIGHTCVPASICSYPWLLFLVTQTRCLYILEQTEDVGGKSWVTTNVRINFPVVTTVACH